jgi:hypothetical protein
MKRILSIVAVLAIACLASSLALAGKSKSASDYQKDFETWTKRLVELQKADVKGVAAQEIEMIRTLITQSQAFVASDKLEQIEPLMRRAQLTADLVEARLKRVAAEDVAAKAEQAAVSAEKAADEAQAGADAAEKRKTDLESQGL